LLKDQIQKKKTNYTRNEDEDQYTQSREEDKEQSSDSSEQSNQTKDAD